MWKELSYNEIPGIEKVVGEFILYENRYTPNGCFRVRIFEKQNGLHMGFASMYVKYNNGYASFEVGYGDNIAEALKSTVEIFMNQLKERAMELKIYNSKFKNEDFERVDPECF